MGKLKALEHLHLYKNHVATVPDAVKQLPNLTELFLDMKSMPRRLANAREMISDTELEKQRANL